MTQAQNPFFEEFKGTPHGTPPFDKIDISHYEPAIDRGIKLGLQGVDEIVANPEAPTFENTIVALENSGRDLDRVLNVFFPLESALSDDAVMELSMKITPACRTTRPQSRSTRDCGNASRLCTTRPTPCD